MRPELVVGMVAGLVRLAVLVADARPRFMSDSGEYLDVAHRIHLTLDRPIGLSLFYRAVLTVRHTLGALVIAQSLLGAITAALVVRFARQLGLSSKFAIVAGVVAGLSPTLLMYERTMLTESLTLFLTVLAAVLFASALRSGCYGRAMVAGLIVGLSAAVRTNNGILLLGIGLTSVACAALPWRTRIGLAMALGFGSAGPLVGYASVNYIWSQTTTGDGVFALSYYDGVSLYGRFAYLTDCSNPSRPPAVRASACAAGPAYLNGDEAALIWGPGPVNSSLGSGDLPHLNAQYRALALENMRRAPGSVLRKSARTLWYDLTATDFHYEQEARRAGYPAVVIERHWGPGAGPLVYSADASERRLQDVYGWWTRFRAIAWVALVLAIAAGAVWRKDFFRSVAVWAVGLFVVPVSLIAVAGAPGPRYLVPYEFIAWIAAAALLQWASSTNTRRWIQSRARELRSRSTWAHGGAAPTHRTDAVRVTAPPKGVRSCQDIRVPRS